MRKTLWNNENDPGQTRASHIHMEVEVVDDEKSKGLLFLRNKNIKKKN